MKIASLASIIFLCLQTSGFAGSLNVYSYRQPELLAPIVEAFEREVGHRVNILFAKKGLVERAILEGENTAADVILTTSVAELERAKAAGILMSAGENLQDIVAGVGDPDGVWVPLSLRPRIFYVSKRLTARGSMVFDDLLKPEFVGRFCTRPLKHAYNLSWLAGMIDRRGRVEVENFLQQLKNQLARTPQGNDRAQVQAIYENICDISIGNAYYYGAMLNSKKQKPWAEAVSLVFAKDMNGGVHVDISGIGVLKASSKKNIAQEFIKFLLSAQAQKIYAQTNHEFPVVDGVENPAIFDGIPAWTASESSLENIANLVPDAARLVDEVGFDIGR